MNWIVNCGRIAMIAAIVGLIGLASGPRSMTGAERGVRSGFCGHIYGTALNQPCPEDCTGAGNTYVQHDIIDWNGNDLRREKGCGGVGSTNPCPCGVYVDDGVTLCPERDDEIYSCL